jgi:DNA-directed RNA polymerase alpha subunit
MTDWRSIAIKLKNALISTEKWWEHKDLLAHVDGLLSDPEERTPIKWLDLPLRIENALLRSGCDTIEKLSTLRDDQILSIRGLGETSIPIIADSLTTWRSTLRAMKAGYTEKK